MHVHMQMQGVEFTIFVINQTDAFRFNRGHLLNVGYEMPSPCRVVVCVYHFDV